MSPVAGPRWRAAAAFIALTAFVLGATATQRARNPSGRQDRSLPPPTLTMHTDRQHPDGTNCDASFDVVRGKLPPSAQPVVTLRVEADRPVPMNFFEQALVARGKKHCADGVSLTQAVAAEDPRWFHEVTAVAWTHHRTQPAVSPPVRVDGGPPPITDGGVSPTNPNQPAPF